MTRRDLIPFLLALPLAVAIGAAGASEWSAAVTFAVILAISVPMLFAMVAPRLFDARLIRDLGNETLDRERLLLPRSALKELDERIAAFERRLDDRQANLARLLVQQGNWQSAAQEQLDIEDPAIAAIVRKLDEADVRSSLLFLAFVQERHTDLSDSLEAALKSVEPLEDASAQEAEGQQETPA